MYIVFMQYHVKTLKMQTLFMMIRNFNVIDIYAIMNLIDQNETLEQIFKFSDPDRIAEPIIVELNPIINKLTPPQIVQRMFNTCG